MSVRRERVELDSTVRRASNGTALIGGSPFRVVRLSAAGARLVDAWLTGEETPPTEQACALRRRLIDAGIVHPLPAASEAAATASVAFVVPVFDDAAGLCELLRAIRCRNPDVSVVVVDDASADRDAIGDVAALFHADLLRHEYNRGPAAARNTGWRHVERCADAGQVVMFIDADVVPTADAVDQTIAHFADESVVAVAPRVRARPGRSVLDRYEMASSPLDLGPQPARVVPRSRVSYVPAAALAVRSTTLAATGGFDESLRLGEDVDFVWRVADGATVRYEPRAVVHHRSRRTMGALVRQRFGYGSSAANLDVRHPGDVAPVDLPALSFFVWIAAAFGGRRARIAAFIGAAVGGVSLARKLSGRVDRPGLEAARLTVFGHRHAVTWMARASTRAWLPLLLLSRRSRPVLAAALVVPPLVEWVRRRPPIDPATFVVLRSIDSAAYCAGVWAGAVRARSARVLLPRLSGWR